MKLFLAPEIEAVRQAIAAEGALPRTARLHLRSLWNAAERLSVASAHTPEVIALVALRREALRLALQVLPVAPLADTAEARMRLTQLVDSGLDDIPEPQVALTIAREAHHRALTALEVHHAHEASILRRQQLSLAAIAVIACLFASIVGYFIVQVAARPDLVKGRTWTQSSKWNECHPEKNDCGGWPTSVFFHTVAESNPWIQYDLETPTAVSAVTVENRKDLGLPRAVPLVVEVSDDGKTFKEVARRNESFAFWTAEFPTVTTRYVRLRIARVSTMHFEAVKVHP